MAIEVLSPIESSMSIKNFGYQFSRMAGMNNQYERHAQDRSDMKNNIPCLIILCLAGIVVIMIG